MADITQQISDGVHHSPPINMPSLFSYFFRSLEKMATPLSRPITPFVPAQLNDYLGLSHPPNASNLSNLIPWEIKVDNGPDGTVPSFLHLLALTPALPSITAAILLSGAGGGVVGPSSIYLSLADKLASLQYPIPALRLDYRYPARNKYCVRDVLAAMQQLEEQYGISRFVLVGWSFGGAPVFTVGGNDHRVVGCAAIASQTAETDGVRSLAPRPLLLLHGTGDRTLSKSCSERLYAQYGTNGDRVLKLYDGYDHALTRNSLSAEKLIGKFIMNCTGLDVEKENEGTLAQTLVSDDEKVELMRKGGDLRRNESMR